MLRLPLLLVVLLPIPALAAAPTAVDDADTTLEDTSVTTDVLANDTDPDNTFPADFTLAVQDGVNYTRVGNSITPVADFNGDPSVPVTVTGNSGAGNATSNVFNLTVSVTTVEEQDRDQARNILLRAVKEYAPENGIDDLVWASRNAAIGARQSDTIVDFPVK